MSAAFEILQRNDLDTYFDIYVGFPARLPCLLFIYSFWNSHATTLNPKNKTFK